MATKRFVVKQHETCPECNGSRWLRQIGWEEFRQITPAIPIDSEEFCRWWRERGYDYAPDEEVICHICDGEGQVENDVDLVEALRHLGILNYDRE